MTQDAAGARIEVVMTPVADADFLAATCALHKIDAVAASSPVGAYAVIAGGLGEAAVTALSTTIKDVPLLLFVAANGRIDASRWKDGARVSKVPAAIALDGAPHELEGILLGTSGIGEVEGAVASRSVSRWKALRMLTSAARRNRRAAR